MVWGVGFRDLMDFTASDLAAVRGSQAAMPLVRASGRGGGSTLAQTTKT